MPKKNYSKWTKSAAASMLAFSLVATPYAISFGEGGKPKVSQSAANAAVLEAELLANMSVTNDSGTTASNRFQLNPNGSQDVDFTISGSSLAQASTVASGNKYVVLGIPEELRGHVAPNGQASIDTAVTVRIDGLKLVEDLINALDAVTAAVATALSATPGIQINIDEVVEQLDVFKTVGAVGQGNFDADVTLSADGEYLVAEIDDGLGLVAAQNLTGAVNNINNAVQALNATGSGLITGGAAAALNTTLAPLKITVNAAANVVNSTITAGGAIINQLADASVLGDTSVTVPTTITGPVDYLNENPNLDAEFVGSVVKTDVLNLSLFNKTDGRTTTYYQGNYADFAAENPTNVNTTGDSTAGYTVTGNATPGDTVTVYNANNEPVGTGTADENGKFEISLDNTVGPEEDLTVKASNDYGESDGVPTNTPADLAAPAAPSDVN
uniref:adhesive domain-containing protein n=1 Tax=Kurthia massiliensis TaxID=1033739 RepID=UPI000289BBB7